MSGPGLTLIEETSVFLAKMPSEIIHEIYAMVLGDEVRGRVLEVTEAWAELRVSKPRPVQTSCLFSDSWVYTFSSTGKFTLQDKGAILHADDLLFFGRGVMGAVDLDGMRELEQFGSIKKIAIDCQCLTSFGAVKDALMLIYAHLRDIDEVFITTSAKSRVVVMLPSHGIIVPSQEIVKFEFARGGIQQSAYWTSIGECIRAIMKQDKFWSRTNRLYKFHNLPGLKRKPKLPAVRLGKVSREKTTNQMALEHIP